MATSAAAEQDQIIVFLWKVEALVVGGFKGAITLQCPGDGSVRSLEIREYFDLARLEAEQKPH